MDKAYWAFDYDNPQFFWLANGYRFVTMDNEILSINMVYSRTEYEVAKIQPLFDAAAQKVIDKAARAGQPVRPVLVIQDANY